jgi:hypothetical protein
MGIEAIAGFATLELIDLISIVPLVVSLRYLAKTNETMSIDDRIMILQVRRAEEALRVIREEIRRTD